MTTDRAPPDVIRMLNRATAAIADSTELHFLVATVITKTPPPAGASVVAIVEDAETLLARYEDGWDDPDLHAACSRLAHVIDVAKRCSALMANLARGGRHGTRQPLAQA